MSRPAVPRPRTTTRRRLGRQRAGLLAVTAVVLVTSLWIFQGVQHAVTTVRTKSAPAVLEIANAQNALSAADAAALGNLPDGPGLTTLPAGREFQQQIEIAGLNLAQAAEDNVAGDDGSQRLQLAQALFTDYTNMMGQAGAHFREKDTVLGTVDLWYAWSLLHRKETGVLAVLGELRGEQEKRLHRQVSFGRMSPLATAGWLVPVVALLGLLYVTQVFLRRRFRRTVSLRLLSATVLVVVLASITSLGLVSRNRAADGAHTVRKVVADRKVEMLDSDRSGQVKLRGFLTTACGNDLKACGYTVGTALGAPPNEPSGNIAKVSAAATAGSKRATGQLAHAAEFADLTLLIPLLAVLAGALAWGGLYPRINEYRFEAR